MVKFKRIVAVIMLGLVTALALPQKAQAQWVVSDPTNLVQNILQYMQDAIMEGDLSEISKLAEARQSYTDLKNRLDELRELTALFQNMGRVGRQLEDITAFGKNIATAGENLSVFVDYFGKCSDYSYFKCARNMYNLYNEMSRDILLEMNELFKAITNMKQGAGLIDYVDAVAKVTNDCNSKLGILESEVNSRMYSLMNSYENKLNYESARALLNKVIL